VSHRQSRCNSERRGAPSRVPVAGMSLLANIKVGMCAACVRIRSYFRCERVVRDNQNMSFIIIVCVYIYKYIYIVYIYIYIYIIVNVKTPMSLCVRITLPRFLVALSGAACPEKSLVNKGWSEITLKRRHFFRTSSFQNPFCFNSLLIMFTAGGAWARELYTLWWRCLTMAYLTLPGQLSLMNTCTKF
jgi:hypothetical protein